MFSMYCKRKFEVEPVEVISADGNSCVYPDLSAYNMEVPLSKITGRIGVSMDASEVLLLLSLSRNINAFQLLISVAHNCLVYSEFYTDISVFWFIRYSYVKICISANVPRYMFSFGCHIAIVTWRF